MAVRRRELIGMGIGGVAAVSLGAAFWDDLFGEAESRPLRRGPGYGPLAAPDENGIRLPNGFRSRIVATGTSPWPAPTTAGTSPPDGMATFPTEDGGFVLVSNSETLEGGASAIRFGRDGRVEDAYWILSGTTQNCSGGGRPGARGSRARRSTTGASGSATRAGAGARWRTRPWGSSSTRRRPSTRATGAST